MTTTFAERKWVIQKGDRDLGGGFVVCAVQSEVNQNASSGSKVLGILMQRHGFPASSPPPVAVVETTSQRRKRLRDEMIFANGIDLLAGETNHSASKLASRKVQRKWYHGFKDPFWNNEPPKPLSGHNYVINSKTLEVIERFD